MTDWTIWQGLGRLRKGYREQILLSEVPRGQQIPRNIATGMGMVSQRHSSDAEAGRNDG